MVIPVGAARAQSLIIVTRTSDGFEMKTLERVSFVPLVGENI
jgi:protein-L-isoaspartate(D-aspartate) O-methyltransferase